MLRKNKGQQFASYRGSTVKRCVSLLLCIRFIFRKISNQLSYVNTLLRFVHSNHKKSLSSNQLVRWLPAALFGPRLLRKLFCFFETITHESLSQGHPTPVFCKISVRRSIYYLVFSFTWGRLKISRRPFYSCAIDFPKFNFSTFQIRFRRKRKPNIFGLEKVMERGIRKILTFVIR